MANLLLNALRRNLVAFEGAGMTEQAKRVKARLAVVEKAAAKADKAAEAEDVADEPSPKTKKET